MINGINVVNNAPSEAFKKVSVVSASKIEGGTSSICADNSKSLNNVSLPSFGQASNVQLKTSLTTEEEQKKFAEITKSLSSSNRNKLNVLLKNGRLLNCESNDKSSTLDNLYKIISQKRANGLDSKGILNDVVVALDNPYTITQKFGDVPTPVANEILNNQYRYATREAAPSSNLLETFKQSGALPKLQPITRQSLNVVSSSCVAASIQFNLAHKNPAEYARIAEGLSSQNTSVTKNIKLTNIAPGDVDAMWLLKEFKVPHKQLDWENVEVRMAPDKNAIVRAQIQSQPSYRDSGERSPVDVLMQSTFMNIGSQHTYTALTDIRTGLLNPDDRGLTEFEKNLAEVLAEGKGKLSVRYQILDDTGKIIGYECPQSNTLKHIKDALNMGENVIVGYTHTDSENRVINGHEITIVGVEKDKRGKEVFVCNDTDDFKDAPVKYDVQYLLPKIHHAGLPQAVLKDDVQIVENWVEVLNQYKNNQNVA